MKTAKDYQSESDSTEKLTSCVENCAASTLAMVNLTRSFYLRLFGLLSAICSIVNAEVKGINCEDHLLRPPSGFTTYGTLMKINQYCYGSTCANWTAYPPVIFLDDRIPPYLQVRTNLSTCISLRDVHHPAYTRTVFDDENIYVPITADKLVIGAATYTWFPGIGTLSDKTFYGMPIVNITCHQMVHLWNLTKSYRVSISIINAIIPAPEIKIFLETRRNQTEVEPIHTMTIDDFPKEYGLTSFQLPNPVACRAYYVQVSCKCSDDIVSKWYILPSGPLSYQLLSKPAIEAPSLIVQLLPNNVYEVERLADPRDSPNMKLLVCNSSQCFEMKGKRNFSDAFDHHFKNILNEEDTFKDSCFTDIPVPSTPSMKATIDFPSTIVVKMVYSAESIREPFINELGSKEKRTSENTTTKMYGWILCPSMADIPTSVLKTFELTWIQGRVQFRHHQKLLFQDLKHMTRQKRCDFNLRTGILTWSFAGVAEACHTDFDIQTVFQKNGVINATKTSIEKGKYNGTSFSLNITVTEDEKTAFDAMWFLITIPHHTHDADHQGCRTKVHYFNGTSATLYPSTHTIVPENPLTTPQQSSTTMETTTKPMTTEDHAGETTLSTSDRDTRSLFTGMEKRATIKLAVQQPTLSTFSTHNAPAAHANHVVHTYTIEKHYIVPWIFIICTVVFASSGLVVYGLLRLLRTRRIQRCRRPIRHFPFRQDGEQEIMLDALSQGSASTYIQARSIDDSIDNLSFIPEIDQHPTHNLHSTTD